MSGRVVHFEIPYDDRARAEKFYADAFGWTTNYLPSMHYTVATTGPVDDEGRPASSGYIGGGMLRRESPTDRPVIVIEVDDIVSTLERIESLGGVTLLGRQAVGDMGWSAYFKDVEGNLMGLFEPSR